MTTATAFLPFQYPTLEVALLMPARVNASRLVDFIARPIRKCRVLNHVFRVAEWSFVMRTSSGRERPISGQDYPDHSQEWLESVRDSSKLKLGYDRKTERGSYEYARALAIRTVMALQVRLKTKEAAIHSLDREYRWGSFLTKLWKGQRVVIADHKLQCLISAHDRIVREMAREF